MLSKGFVEVAAVIEGRDDLDEAAGNGGKGQDLPARRAFLPFGPVGPAV